MFTSRDDISRRKKRMGSEDMGSAKLLSSFPLHCNYTPRPESSFSYIACLLIPGVAVMTNDYHWSTARGFVLLGGVYVGEFSHRSGPNHC